MSLDLKENTAYKSLPQNNNFRSQKTVNFAMPQVQSQTQTQQQHLHQPSVTKISIPIHTNSLSSSSSSSVSTSAPATQRQQQQQQQPLNGTNVTNGTNGTNGTSKVNNSASVQPNINTEEFAKLDALLEDLLAEVEQPILLNKEAAVAAWADTNNSLIANKRVNSFNDGLQHINVNSAKINNKENMKINSNRQLNGTDELERSVDWLNEQKERLRSRKELVNSYSLKHNPIKSSNDINYINNNSNSNISNGDDRKIKSKIDYYVSNGTGGIPLQPHYASNSLQKSLANQTNKNGFSYLASNPILKANGHTYQQEYNHIDQSYEVNSNDHSPAVTLNGHENNGHYCSNHYVNNKPPVSPNSGRQLYSPNVQSAAVPLNYQNNSAPFRSLSTNPTLLRNITETDDMEHEFDRYSQRSFRSNVSTVQRSKYHTVSNDFVECTRPAAPTPVPTYHTNKASNPSKRALSAPPTEMGKVVLQRMELKSPLTVRQGSVVPFAERHQLAQYPYEQQQQIIQRVQTPINGATLSSRVVLKPNTNTYINGTGSQVPPTTSINCPPTRNVFLNRAYSETPRVGYTNGYETDSGLSRSVTSNAAQSFRTNNATYNQSASFNQNLTDSEQECVRAANGYTSNGYRTIGNGYRTIQTTPSRYNTNGHQSGYETDTGLIKLRQVLDQNRRTSSRLQQQQQQQQHQIIPVSNGTTAYYYPNNRSMTPSFAYAYNQQNPQFISNQYALSPEPITHTQQYIVTTYPNDIETIDFIDGAEFVSQQTQQTPQFQYSQGSNGVVEKITGYIAHDGRPVILNDVIDNKIQMMNNEDFNGSLPTSQSLIIQQQIAPQAYQTNPNLNDRQQNENDMNNNLENNLNGGTTIQLNGSSRDVPRIGQQASSNGNLASMSSINGQLNQSQQLNRQDSRRSSTNSLVAESTEILRNHPKSVKTTQNYWYKPKISRDEAINLLKDKPPGTFLIRDSNNFPGAYGLALKVDKPPPNVQVKPGVDPLNELVRHFLIEPTTKGVRIKGCYNEPIFGSLAALVYQHSLTPLALPIKLILPTQDLISTLNGQKSKNNDTNGVKSPQAQQQQTVQDARHLLEKGAACNVYYLNSVTVENKNGIEAISTALNGNKAFQAKDSSQLLLIQFKVTAQGVTLTDINKKKFLRQHFPTNTVTYCAIEEKQTWPSKLEKIQKPRIFGVITKPQAKSLSSEVHLFVELDPDQPAIAIVDFINRYLIPSKTDTKNKN